MVPFKMVLPLRIFGGGWREGGGGGGLGKGLALEAGLVVRMLIGDGYGDGEGVVIGKPLAFTSWALSPVPRGAGWGILLIFLAIMVVFFFFFCGLRPSAPAFFPPRSLTCARCVTTCTLLFTREPHGHRGWMPGWASSFPVPRTSAAHTTGAKSYLGGSYTYLVDLSC